MLFTDVSINELFTKFQRVPHITVWKREDIPHKYFYTYNRRILDMLIVADNSWQICANKDCQLIGMLCSIYTPFFK